MPRVPADRAKQFVPFAALNGYYDMIAELSRFREDRRDLMADRLVELDATLSGIRTGECVRVEHYTDGVYELFSGCLDKVDRDGGAVVVAGRRIAIEDILDIKRADQE